MVQTCTQCSRANPVEAVYCYYDGIVLGRARRGRPLAVGAQPFGSPFVFPGGRACRSFDELALACQEDWAAARDLLRQGYLETFLGGLGRVDLALAAKEAARFPDRDRGLDQLLAALPSKVLDEPALRVAPQEVNLGVLDRAGERRFDLHLENKGMRLLYGSVNSEESWLVLGDAPGVVEKHFQFNHEQVIPVRVRGDLLRAGNKPLEAKLLVESNAGAVEVVVRADVPVKPFPPGVFAGARSPRQVAEKAKANPKEAAPLFEAGAVADWYKLNGWTYPVQGPSASGLGAVQQFFEALGLTPPPKVQISTRAITLQGSPGDRLTHTLEVKSDEKKHIYAHGASNQPWLEVGRPKLHGRVAQLKVVVPAVPDRPGETLTARVSVKSNGNQRFEVPVTLQVVGGAFDFAGLTETVKVSAVTTPPPVTPPPLVSAPAAPAPTLPPPLPVARPKRDGWPAWAHLIPAALLLVVLVGVFAFDFINPARTDNGSPGDGDRGSGLLYELTDPEPRLGYVKSPSGNYRYGLVLLKEADPNNPEQHKRLTYVEGGSTNNTCVLIDGHDHLYGQKPGQWGNRPEEDEKRHYWKTNWSYPADGVLVTQEVQIVPGAQSGLLDTCLVRYTVKNNGTVPRTVGLRVMFDTFIGGNDGVPFTIPGREGLVTKPQTFEGKDVPDYLQALERPDPNDPGTVAHMGLRGIDIPGVKFEPIKTLVICPFPDSEARWEVEVDDAAKERTIADSAVLLYWDYREMKPGAVRHMAFSYGLNAISTPEGAGNLALTAGGSFVVNNDFTVTAYVKQPQAGQKVRLRLPEGLSLLPDEEAEKEVSAKGEYTQVSWRVHSAKVGEYLLSATTTAGARASYKIKITPASLFR